MSDDPIIQAHIDFIAKEIRQAFEDRKPITLANVERHVQGILKEWHGSAEAAIDPDDPTKVIITFTPPKMIVYEFEIGPRPEVELNMDDLGTPPRGTPAPEGRERAGDTIVDFALVDKSEED